MITLHDFLRNHSSSYRGDLFYDTDRPLLFHRNSGHLVMPCLRTVLSGGDLQQNSRVIDSCMNLSEARLPP